MAAAEVLVIIFYVKQVLNKVVVLVEALLEEDKAVNLVGQELNQLNQETLVHMVLVTQAVLE